MSCQGELTLTLTDYLILAHRRFAANAQ